MAEGDGGIMQKILSITSPPNNTASSKQRRSKQPKPPQQPPTTRHNYIDNRSYCEACGDGGDLLCCERCPSSFHFGCCDPPLDPLHLPEGEWVCQGCRPSPAHLDEHSNKLFKPLLIQCCSENPLVFSLPDELMSIVAWKDVKHDKKSKQDSSVIKFCYFCDKSSRHGRIISCDFCPLSYHMDCLTPPLTDRPISSTWMCPNHVEHRISDLQDVRLTKRKEALEKCRADVSRHSIKMDFFSSLNKIPGYHRNSSRSNRRASEVPMSIKAMYSEPLSDTHTTCSLIELLMTASEELELLRRETREEREGVGRGNCTVATGNCDEWTRHAVLSQTTPTSDHTHRSTLDDLKDILSASDHSNEATPICNGFNGPMESLDQMKHPKHINGLATPPNNVELGVIVPNVDGLSDGLVQLLAQQRIQQLFSDGNDSSMSCDSHVIKHFSRHSNRQSSGGSPPLVILCPLSTLGPAHCMYKRIVTIGSSCSMDICLKDYGHCNFVSTHHACLILDKDSSEHELINYSEHGSIIDGVLYSCDFSDKMSNDPAPSLLLDDITSRGTGSRGERARMRLEHARKSLQEKSQANKAISAAYKLSKSVVRDYVPDPNAIAAAGIKRRRSLEPSECSGPLDESLPLDDSSIVSIPLSKTKKSNSSNDRHNKDHKKPLTVNTESSETAGADYRPCMCRRSASSLIGTGGKGWEGAAAVYHGSKLRFGCIQLVVSVSDKPGFNELQQTLTQHKLL